MSRICRLENLWAQKSQRATFASLVLSLVYFSGKLALMANPSGQRNCGICRAPQTVRAAVDSALLAEPRKKSLRELETETAFSRATLSRHFRRCLPKAVMLEHRAKTKINVSNRGGLRTVVQWPDAPLFEGRRLSIMGECDDDGVPIALPPEEFKAGQDILLRVEFVKSKIHNPKN